MSHGLELLAPAGNLEKLKTVLRYGADAAYLGGKAFNLRAGSANFSMESLREGVAYAHSLGKRVYVTLNTAGDNWVDHFYHPLVGGNNTAARDTLTWNMTIGSERWPSFDCESLQETF